MLEELTDARDEMWLQRPCERIESWSCLLDAEEKRPLTGAQGLDGESGRPWAIFHQTEEAGNSGSCYKIYWISCSVSKIMKEGFCFLAYIE